MKVYRFTQPDGFTYCVLADKDVKKELFRDCFNNNGQYNGPLLDFSPDDTEGIFWGELLNELKTKPSFTKAIKKQGIDAEDIICDYADLEITEYKKWLKESDITLPKSILAIIADWLHNEPDYQEVEVFNYWDGNNWQSLYLEGELDGDLLEVSDEEAAPIIAVVKKAQEAAPYFDGVSDSRKFNGYEVFRTRWTSDPFIARVNEL